MAPSDEPSSLPPNYETQLQHLQADAWRERKQAVAALKDLVAHERGEAERLRSLALRLLDALLAPDALEGRAACHEVLISIGASAVPLIVDRIRRPGPGRRLLVDLLGDVGSVEHVPLLTALLADPEADPNLQSAAATALGRIGGDEAVTSLVALLQAAPEMLENHALAALEQTRAPVPVKVLEPCVKSLFTRRAAVGVLAHSADPVALELLVPLLDDPQAGVRAEVARSLVRLDELFREAGRPDLVRAALTEVAAPIRSRLHELVAHADRDVRAAAIRLCGLAGDASALESVLDVMDDPLIQEEALSMVATLGAEAGRALGRAGRDGSMVKREHLLRLVGALAPQHVGEDLVRVLVQSLHEPEEEAATAAAEALETAGGKSALAELYRIMARPGRLGEAAADAMAAVVTREQAEAELDFIAGTVWPQEGELARNLCRVVGIVGSSRYAPHLVSMLGSIDVGVRIAAAQALGGLHGEHEGAGALSFALTDEEPQVRAAACRSLGQLAAPSAVQPLMSATADDSPLVRVAAVQALVALDNPVALARLRAIIAEDPVPAVVVQAIAGLGRSKLDQDLTMLMSLCTSADWEVVKAAARALTPFARHRATAALLGLLGHERWDVRWAAAEVLAARGDKTALPSLRQARAAEDDTLVSQILDEAIATLEREG